MMRTFLDFFGVIMALLTTTPIGKLLMSLDSTIHIRHLVILLVLPWTTLTELAGILDRLMDTAYPHLAYDVIQTCIRDFFLASEELVSEVLNLTELLLTCSLRINQ